MSAFERILHDNGIQELIYHEATREAVDRYLEVFEQIINETVQSGVIGRVLVNFVTPVLPPVAYVTKQGRRLVTAHFADRDKIRIRSAILAPASAKPIISLMQTFLSMLPMEVTIANFVPEQRIDAENWLLSDG